MTYQITIDEATSNFYERIASITNRKVEDILTGVLEKTVEMMVRSLQEEK